MWTKHIAANLKRGDALGRQLTQRALAHTSCGQFRIGNHTGRALERTNCGQFRMGSRTGRGAHPAGLSTVIILCIPVYILYIPSFICIYIYIHTQYILVYTDIYFG
jgi:hypothetical protein